MAFLTLSGDEKNLGCVNSRRVSPMFVGVVHRSSDKVANPRMALGLALIIA
jgi:hypothetical protein